MKVRTILSTLALCSLTVALASCGKNVTGPEPTENPGNEENPPEGFPPIPYPAEVNSDIPDSSEIYVTIASIAGKKVDFAPIWATGRFTWDVDIQTQKEDCIFGCVWHGDPPGDYWNGTRNSTAMTFEGGTVDLRNPTPKVDGYGPHSRRVQFIQDGNLLSTPFNPDRSYTWFEFIDYPHKRLEPVLFGGYVVKAVDPAFGETQRRRMYYVAATACQPVTAPVYIKRERYWKRIPLHTTAGTVMSVTLDPGASYEVSYTWSSGVNIENSTTFTRTVNGEITLGTEKSVIGAKLGGSLSEAFTTTVQVNEESSVTVTKTLTGIPDKTTVYSAWTTVERFTIVDEAGNPYTDPNFTFSDLGTSVIVGSREQISSKSFPHETGSVTQ